MYEGGSNLEGTCDLENDNKFLDPHSGELAFPSGEKDVVSYIIMLQAMPLGFLLMSQ